MVICKLSAVSSLAVAIESGRIVRWVTFPGTGHHHDYNLLVGLHQAVHAQLVERKNLQTCVRDLIQVSSMHHIISISCHDCTLVIRAWQGVNCTDIGTCDKIHSLLSHALCMNLALYAVYANLGLDAVLRALCLYVASNLLCSASLRGIGDNDLLSLFGDTSIGIRCIS